jgi:stage II sporulation protein AB (anti-sigma F factor)
MTQKKLQSQVEEEHMSEQNKPEVLKMEVEALSKNEEFARVAVAVFLARLNPTLEEVDDVKTAVSEAVTNAVIHGYQGKGGMIYLVVEATGQEFTITIRDTGIGIPDIKQAMEPMFTTDPDGERTGMGFSFMEAFMDQVEVQSAPGEGTAVTMKKKISG